MSEDEAGRLAGKCALVVDDEHLIAEDMAHLLRRMGAEICGPFPSLDEARAGYAAHDGPVDFAVLDIMLGKDNIWPFAKELKADKVPIMLVSAVCDDTLRLPPELEGTDCIRKPASDNQIRRCAVQLCA